MDVAECALFTTLIPEVWLALSTEPYSCPTACAGVPVPEDADRIWLGARAEDKDPPPSSCPNSPKPLQDAFTHMQLRCSSEDRPQSKGWACACLGVCRKPIKTDQCRVDCRSFNLASLRVLPCKFMRKLDINRLTSANKWFLPSSLSPPDQVTGSSQEPSELTHCSCTGMGNPQPRACQWKHPAINSQMSKSRNCN